jgi:hypothetical protein
VFKFLSFVLVDSFLFFTFDIVLRNLLDFLGAVLSGEPFLFVFEHLSLPAKIDLFVVVDDFQVCFLQLTFEYSVRKLVFFEFQ